MISPTEAFTDLLETNSTLRSAFAQFAPDHSREEALMLLVLVLDEALKDLAEEAVRAERAHAMTRIRFEEMLNTSQSHFAVVRRN